MNGIRQYQGVIGLALHDKKIAVHGVAGGVEYILSLNIGASLLGSPRDTVDTRETSDSKAASLLKVTECDTCTLQRKVCFEIPPL